MAKQTSDNVFVSRFVTYKDDGVISLRLFMAILETGCQLLSSRRLCVVDEGNGMGSWFVNVYIRKRDVKKFEELTGMQLQMFKR